jgi:hypothetical protein
MVQKTRYMWELPEVTTVANAVRQKDSFAAFATVVTSGSSHKGSV